MFTLIRPPAASADDCTPRQVRGGKTIMSNPVLQIPEKVELEESSKTRSFGRFFVQPLEKGFGVTLGNSFRRVLLSSLPGTAITAIRIDSIQHEFSTVKGVVEDVSDMVLNLKQIRMRAINKKLTKLLVPVKGPGKFVAGDIQKATGELEILNPDVHIATLNKDANFEMELRLGRGRGYAPAEENKASDQPIGMIAIDSIFSPIQNVRFFVETTRVGGQIDFEKLILEIETDGSITPEDALTHAGKTLRDHIQLFINFGAEPEAEKPQSEQEAEVSTIRKNLMMSVDE
ncbi:MAG: DNA-directed RNA polymerase subunit alpha, partial [Bacteroidota bacterium]